MAEEIAVSLSIGNWHRVLDSLRGDVEHLDIQLEDVTHDDDFKTRAFVEREELQGVIEQIEDQVAEELRRLRAERYAELTAAHGTFAVTVDDVYRRLSEQIARLED
jgi:hypothetical protein